MTNIRIHDDQDISYMCPCGELIVLGHSEKYNNSRFSQSYEVICSKCYRANTILFKNFIPDITVDLVEP